MVAGGVGSGVGAVCSLGQYGPLEQTETGGRVTVLRPGSCIEENGNSVEPLGRRDLQEIRDAAHEMGISVTGTRTWERAYNRLAAAADCLDAMLARSEDREF